jgi:hypothetical protein
LFEFQRHGMSTEEFCSRLDGFFGQLLQDFLYAVEIRNAGLLGPDYRKVLEAHGVGHVYNQRPRKTLGFQTPAAILEAGVALIG